uniref:Uncharacterized protein n=1 Tax=Micrurus spixii TaxID=129469 RepID=A0A2D4MKC4_9SAUR
MQPKRGEKFVCLFVASGSCGFYSLQNLWIFYKDSGLDNRPEKGEKKRKVKNPKQYLPHPTYTQKLRCKTVTWKENKPRKSKSAVAAGNSVFLPCVCRSKEEVSFGVF